MYPTLLERLKSRGYRLTAQRRVVAEVLTGENMHLTADEVLERAEAILPEVSRATVYSTLQQFSDLGEVRELQLDGRSKRYDPNVQPAHHHLVCEGCGQVFDVAHGETAPVLGEHDRHGMSISTAEIVYRGCCVDCQQ
jgi:Fe2+ or Zn2+ uptake regulation protein